jgi:hypothetical protein
MAEELNPVSTIEQPTTTSTRPKVLLILTPLKEREKYLEGWRKESKIHYDFT